MVVLTGYLLQPVRKAPAAFLTSYVDGCHASGAFLLDFVSGRSFYLASGAELLAVLDPVGWGEAVVGAGQP